MNRRMKGPFRSVPPFYFKSMNTRHNRRNEHGRQDNRRSDYPFGEITEKIIGRAFEVIKAGKTIAPDNQAQIIN